MDNALSIYEDFFGEREGENHSFSFFRKPIRNVEPLRCITIPDIYRYIVGPYAQRQTETLRAIIDKDAARKYKAENFDFCTFSGTFRIRNKNHLLLHSELLCIDFDHVADIPSLRERLLHDDYFETELLFRSPSGDGLKWVIDIERKGWEHSRFYNAVYNYLVASGYPEPDKSGSDVARSCFIPYDPEAYINSKYPEYVRKENFLPEQWENAPSNSNAAKNAPQQMTSYNNIGGECTYDKVDRVIGLIEESGVDITEGYDAWVKVGFALASEFKESGRDFFHRVSKVNAKYNHAETDKQYDKCLASTGSGVTIGTFFQMAKDRGVDISNAKPDVPPTEIQNAHIGNMDFWKNGDSDKAPQPQSANIHKAKNPNVHSCEIGGKWIYDEEELPHFPSFVYETLPPFLKEVVDNCISPDDRDMILMGAMTCLSITLHNVVGEYNHDDWGPMLYFFVMADAGMGKGSLNYCRQLVAPIHKELREISDQQIREYKAEKRQAKQDGNTFSGEEPHRRTLFIPTNSSAASVIEQLDYNDGIGLIFDTECDTLTAVLKSEFGDYTTIIRKAYHHEPIDIKRRKENEDRLVEHPMLAICLSGTPEQLYTLTPKAEDGTFSRITCYHIPFKMDFRDVLSESSFPEGKHSTSLRDVYYQLGLRYKRMRETFFRGGNYRVVIPQDLCEEFNQHYRLVNKEAVEDISNDMQGVIRRLAFAVFRMMMVLTAIRFMDETQNPSALAQKDVRTILRCKEEDFRIAMALGDTLIYHTVYCYSHLPKTDVATTIGGKILTKKDKMEMLYAALPDSFSRPQYVAVSTDLGFSPSTTSKWINTFILQGRLERCEHNDYRKLTPNSSEAS